jgi:hypothetical protein
MFFNLSNVTRSRNRYQVWLAHQDLLAFKGIITALIFVPSNLFLLVHSSSLGNVAFWARLVFFFNIHLAMEWYDIPSDVLEAALDQDGPRFTVDSLSITPSHWNRCNNKQVANVHPPEHQIVDVVFVV